MPTGSTYEWREITFAEYTLAASTKYAIVVRATSGNGSNYLRWCRDASSPTYTGGNDENSSNSGSTWTADTNDYMFEVWGNPGIVIPTVTTQAATSIGLD